MYNVWNTKIGLKPRYQWHTFMYIHFSLLSRHSLLVKPNRAIVVSHYFIQFDNFWLSQFFICLFVCFLLLASFVSLSASHLTCFIYWLCWHGYLSKLFHLAMLFLPRLALSHTHLHTHTHFCLPLSEGSSAPSSQMLSVVSCEYPHLCCAM